MKQDTKFMNWLLSEAKELPRVGGARVASVLVFKGVPVAFGTNERKTSPFAAYYGKNNDAIYFHAETRVLNKATKNISMKKLSQCTLYVARVKKIKKTDQMVPGLAKPCKGCMAAISDFPPARVVYSLDETEEFEVLENEFKRK